MSESVEVVYGNKVPSIVVCDGWYDKPDEIRAMALAAKYTKDERFYKGTRSDETFRFPYLKERIESFLGQKITNWALPVNGKFQWTGVQDQLVYHRDGQRFAGAVYLTPNAPVEAGTSFYTQKENGIKYSDDHIHFDKTSFVEVDKVSNFYNRLVIWPGTAIHSATANFGDTLENGRLTQIFFFE